jgi:hypothetical protein
MAERRQSGVTEEERERARSYAATMLFYLRVIVPDGLDAAALDTMTLEDLCGYAERYSEHVAATMALERLIAVA